MANSTNVIVDTDLGSEMTDAAALILAAISPEIEILGVTSVTHDAVFRASVAKKILKLLGKESIPVAVGIGKEYEHAWEKDLIFPEGYRPLELDQRPAWQLITDLADQNKENVCLVGIGTTSNIAAALEKDSDLPHKISKLVLMGGMIEPPVVDGKIIPMGFEYNFCNDSASVEKLIKAGFRLTIVPGDLTFQQDDPWTEDELKELADIKNPVIELLVKLKNRSLIAMKEGLEKAGLPLEFAKPWVNDELLMAYLIKPELFETKDVFIKWELPDKYPRLIVSDTGYPITIVNKTNFKTTRRFILERVNQLSDLRSRTID